MGYFKDDYSPTELLNITKIKQPIYGSRDIKEHFVTKMLAAVAANQGNPDKVQETLGTIAYTMLNETISTGAALDYITDLTKMGKELQGNHDGVDALCYHLSSHTVEEAIRGLKKILVRFEEISKADGHNYTIPKDV